MIMRTQHPSINIFVSHRIDLDSETINNSEIYIPVRCGATFDSQKDKAIPGDDTGINISNKRMSFNELTVLYWAWKNKKLDKDYYGLCHYRRYLAFSEYANSASFSKDERNNGCVSVKFLDTEIAKQYGLDDESIQQGCSGYDAIFVKPIDLSDFGITSNYMAMHNAEKYHKMEDVDKAIEIVSNKYPYMKSAVDHYMFNYNYSYLYNCFIMKRDIFNNFCTWLFDILFELEKHLNTQRYSISQYRTPGTIAERLLGIYILYLKQQKNINIKEVPLLFIEHTEKTVELKPISQKRNVAIASNFDENYAPYFGVFLQSALSYTSPEFHYDFIVISRNLTSQSKKLLLSIVKNQNNVSLRIIDPSKILHGINLKIKHNVYTEDLYYRIVIPYILKNYNKVLVVDADMICREDLKNLYIDDVDNYLAAGIKDTIFQGYLNGADPNRLKYCKDYMKLEEPFDYINTGVILFNCKLYRERFSLDFLRTFIEKHVNKVLIYEQDMLNMLLQKNIKFLDQKWNSFTITNSFLQHCIDLAPYHAVDKWKQGQESKKGIIHYANIPKPWQDIHTDFADLWWSYAKSSPFYEIILFKAVDFKINLTKPSLNPDLIYGLISYKKNRFNYIRYKILSKITWGKRKQHYKQKSLKLRNIIKYTRDFKRQMKSVIQ